MSRRAGRSLVIVSVLALQGCVYLPRTVFRYDHDCRIVARQMVLEEVQLGEIRGCANQGCVALVVAASVTAAASAIISGSITVVGNIAYWVEKRVQCQEAPPTTRPVTPPLAVD